MTRKRRDFTSSRDRDRRRLANAQIGIRRPIIGRTVELTEEKQESVFKRGIYSPEELEERKVKVMIGEANLPSAVRLLFEQTRDGKPISEDYRSELLQPLVEGKDIFEAISLGIKAWAPTLLSKER